MFIASVSRKMIVMVVSDSLILHRVQDKFYSILNSATPVIDLWKISWNTSYLQWSTSFKMPCANDVHIESWPYSHFSICFHIFPNGFRVFFCWRFIWASHPRSSGPIPEVLGFPEGLSLLGASVVFSSILTTQGSPPLSNESVMLKLKALLPPRCVP